MIQSGGVLRKSYTTLWEGSPAQWNGGWPGRTSPWQMESYGEMFRTQPWVFTLVTKLGKATARLPDKTYLRTENDGRDDGRDHPFGRLMADPSSVHDPFFFWLWTASTMELDGEAFWGKVRDAGGRPVELVLLHPRNVHTEYRDRKVLWFYDDGEHRIEIDRRDLVHFKAYNPFTSNRGMPALEPLRSTLENEDGARRANSAILRNGGRPSMFLTHPGTLSQGAADRVARSWNEIHAGVDNWAKVAVLEEGLEPKTLAFNSEELQYVESRRLNREEVCAAYDVPPPVVHILDRATFSNITEQMRSMYRDTMAPRLKQIESVIQKELRDGRRSRTGEPDFGAEVYFEFLLDEVLRGDFEQRVASNAMEIQTGQSTPAEVRRRENRPFIEGTDRLFINAALVDINTAGMPAASADDALTADQLRSLMGRLSRPLTLDAIDPAALTAGLNGKSPLVLAALDEARSLGESVPEFRARIAALGGPR